MGDEADDGGGVRDASSERVHTMVSHKKLKRGQVEMRSAILTFGGAAGHAGSDTRAAAAVLLRRFARHDAQAAKESRTSAGTAAAILDGAVGGDLTAVPAGSRGDDAAHEDA